MKRRNFERGRGGHSVILGCCSLLLATLLTKYAVGAKLDDAFNDYMGISALLRRNL